jgi:hypothetical protein
MPKFGGSEVSEWLDRASEGLGVHIPDKSARQLDAPSRDSALGHGSARF